MMKSTEERLYDQACHLCNVLYYRRQSDPRFPRLYAKATERQSRRGERLQEHWEAEHESLLMAEAEASYSCHRVAELEKACKAIVALASGWDKDGALGPRPPLSWETVARMAMDYARSALSQTARGALDRMEEARGCE